MNKELKKYYPNNLDYFVEIVMGARKAKMVENTVASDQQYWLDQHLPIPAQQTTLIPKPLLE